MSDEHDKNVQIKNQQCGSSSDGGNLPKPDPDLSDPQKRDGEDIPNVVNR